MPSSAFGNSSNYFNDHNNSALGSYTPSAPAQTMNPILSEQMIMDAMKGFDHQLQLMRGSSQTGQNKKIALKILCKEPVVLKHVEAATAASSAPKDRTAPSNMATTQQPASTSVAHTTSDDVFVPIPFDLCGGLGPKNLLSIDHSTSHPDATSEECAIAFKALDDEELKRYRALGQKRRHEMKDK
ncbi:hypothetical protein BOTBODRAFT_178735 [Botryobasidium botryosum FD-172 SS1]|uniref:Uncharacterized protein n=1 Tax=Botryobasidium botryosum (strain FD-172 SS1) TaxID=930990 RepID=A0A067MDB1_BOTB1|nr:hypothetical protein BOTBODRAFT_178735 [Botryobasidium botryosum FD-172 SS1]